MGFVCQLEILFGCGHESGLGGLEDNWKPLDTAVTAPRRLTEEQTDCKTAFLPLSKTRL